jgi:hypothetical protein
MPHDHEISVGENIFEIAARTGFSAEYLWDLPQNKKLADLRIHMNVLLPGDVLHIPDPTPFSRSCAMHQRHVFRRKGIPPKLRLQLLEEGEPKANMKFALTVDGLTLTGVTDAHGNLEAFVPADAVDGELLLGDQSIYHLQFGELNPPNEIAGVQTRLNNLGFDCGKPTGEWNPETAAALRYFQGRVNLPETGELDDATRRKLYAVHDGAETLRLPRSNS